jgi:hypothetical protein
MSGRRLALLLGLCALGWALALLRPAPEPAASAGPDAARAADARAASAQPEPSAASAPGAQPRTQPESDRPAAGQAPTEATAEGDAERRAREERLADEGKHRHDQRFDSAVERWKEEQSKPRDEPWASRREDTLRRAINHDRLERLVQRIECRATLCRIQLAAADAEIGLRLRNAHHFMREVGFQTAGAFAGEGEKRQMLLYVAREGTRL